MKKLYISILTICSAYIVTAQAPDIEWQVTLGGTGLDEAKAVKQTPDGGFIIAGQSNSTNGDVTGNHGNEDYWVVKLNGDGSINWQKSLGGSGIDLARSVDTTTDGGIIVAGSSTSNNGDVTGNHGNADYWIVKLNGDGAIQWQKSLGGSNSDGAYSVQQTNDGGYIVAGTTTSTDGDVTGNSGGIKQWIVKLNSTGTIQWQKLLNGGMEIDIEQDSDNSFIVAFGNKIYKLDASGNTQWDWTGGWNDQIYSVKPTNDNGFIATGRDGTSNSSLNYWVVKLNASGNEQWKKIIGNEESYDEARDVQPTFDGGYIVIGTKYIDNEIPPNVWTVKLDNLGNIEWEKLIGETEGFDIMKTSNAVQQTIDGGYIIGGTQGSFATGEYSADYLVIKLASNFTHIPDAAFEQRLIDLGLDDVLDGYVQTSNINDVTQLDVSNRNISDLTGIEDFASLISLNCSNNQLTSLVFGDGIGGKNVNATNDFGLEYLNASGNQLTELDVSGLSHLTTLLVNNNALTKLNVQNGNNTNFTAFNAVHNSALFCIQVDNAAWSTTNWTNIDAHTSFNEDCAYMSVTDSQLSQLEIYPNPAKDVVHFSKAIDGELFNAIGQKVRTIRNASSLNVSALPKGVYIFVTEQGISRKLIVK